MSGDGASPATTLRDLEFVETSVCLSLAVPGGERGDGTGVGSTQKPPSTPSPAALNVGDRGYPLSEVYSQWKDCWDLSTACKHTPGRFQLRPQHYSRRLKQKVAALFSFRKKPPAQNHH